LSRYERAYTDGQTDRQMHRTIQSRSLDNKQFANNLGVARRQHVLIGFSTAVSYKICYALGLFCPSFLLGSRQCFFSHDLRCNQSCTNNVRALLLVFLLLGFSSDQFHQLADSYCLSKAQLHDILYQLFRQSHLYESL